MKIFYPLALFAPGAGALAAESADDGCARLLAAHVHGADLDAAEHDAQQPRPRLHPRADVGQVQHPVPEKTPVRFILEPDKKNYG